MRTCIGDFKLNVPYRGGKNCELVERLDLVHIHQVDYHVNYIPIAKRYIQGLSEEYYGICKTSPR